MTSAVPPDGPAPPPLAAEFDALVQALWTWSPSRWTPPRIAAARDLVESLAALGDGPAIEVPHVEAYALADQIAVVGHDLLRPATPPGAATKARALLAAARTALA